MKKKKGGAIEQQGRYEFVIKTCLSVYVRATVIFVENDSGNRRKKKKRGEQSGNEREGDRNESGERVCDFYGSSYSLPVREWGRGGGTS